MFTKNCYFNFKFYNFIIYHKPFSQLDIATKKFIQFSVRRHLNTSEPLPQTLVNKTCHFYLSPLTFFTHFCTLYLAKLHNWDEKDKSLDINSGLKKNNKNFDIKMILSR